MHEIRFELKPYDLSIANKIINTKQHTLLWHTHNAKASHSDLKGNNKFAEWAELTCKSDELGYVKVCRGKKYNYLGITLDYSTRGTFKMDITDYVNAMKEDFFYETNKTLKAWNDKTFLIDTNNLRLDKEKSDAFNAFTMKCIFLCKRGQPDIEPRVGF